MRVLLDHPIILLLVLLVIFGLATRLGAAMRVWLGPVDESKRGDFDIVLGASLTLLSLIVGFSFAMAGSRYDQRKNLEEEEANAIGTAYARADLLPAGDAARVKGLLRDYANLRIRFYTVTDYGQRRELAATTNRAQRQLWQAVTAPAIANPNALTAIAAASMNDAINAQGYAQAAKWNRIPTAAWSMLCTIGIIATMLIGFRFQAHRHQRMLMLVIPALVAISMGLIADIDCPLGGVILVEPQNLAALAGSLQ